MPEKLPLPRISFQGEGTFSYVTYTTQSFQMKAFILLAHLKRERVLRSGTPHTIRDRNPHLKPTALNRTVPYGTIWPKRDRMGVGKGI
jgi:hypothetical protein